MPGNSGPIGPERNSASPPTLAAPKPAPWNESQNEIVLKRPVAARLYTDSEYVRRGIGEWLPAWKARGWKTAAKKPVKNQDLWEALDAAASRHRVEWHWVKAHSGIEGNERVDALANEAIDAMLARGLQ